MRAWSVLGLFTSLVATVYGEEEHRAVPLRTHSLSPPYLDSHMQSRWFDFGGDTVIRTDQYVRLTGELASRAGWAWSRVPLTATSWEIEVTFKIGGQGVLYGDGMAIWLTKQRAQGGNVFGSMDKFDGLGIFIDTYKNNRPGTVFPYIMAMMGDGQTSYDKEHDGKANELAGCSARNIRNAPHPTKLKIQYIQEKSLTVHIAQDHDENKWDHCFTLDRVKIPSVAYLGFSAETGELADAHDIVAVETRNLYTPEIHGANDGPTSSGGQSSSKSRRQKNGSGGSSGGWLWFFFKFILFGLTVTGAYVGYTAYRTQKNRHRF